MKLINIENVVVSGIEQSFVASGYPMRTDFSNVSEEININHYWISKYTRKLEITNKYESYIEFLESHKKLMIGEDSIKSLDGVIATAKRVSKLGSSKPASGHNCFAKGITVDFDLTISQAMAQQLKRYHFIDCVSSSSTMHRITKIDIRRQCNKYVSTPTIAMMNELVCAYNHWDEMVECGSIDDMRKGIWIAYGIEVNTKRDLFYAIVYNIPSGFRLSGRWTTNYLQLITIYNQRKHHKLDEWREFCDWCENLPFFKEIFGINK